MCRFAERVMKYLLLFTLAACGGNVDAPQPCQAHDASAPDAHDAGVDHELEAAPEASSDAARDAGGLLCCATGQNLLVCDPSSPWPCLASPTHASPCTDPACSPGYSCQGFQGMGTVVACGTGPGEVSDAGDAGCMNWCVLFAGQTGDGGFDPDAGYGITVTGVCCTPMDPCTACLPGANPGCNFHGTCAAP
jgi:hypothetical protein